MSNRVYFNLNFEERDEERDTIQDWTVRFEENAEDFDGALKTRLNTFLEAIGSNLAVS